MVDMMMAYDASIEQGQYHYFSQTYGSAFASWAYVYHKLEPVLNDSLVEVAYLDALAGFFHSFEQQGPTGIQADMDLPSLVGMWYTAWEAEGEYSAKALAYAHTFFEKHFNEAGYIDHGGGFDPSYNGVSMKYMAWLAHATGWDFVIDALAKMSKLKAHLTFPEPTDEGLYKFYGPSNMATATVDGSPRDQHWTFGRDVAVSYLTDEAAYLRYTGRNLNAWDQPYGLKTPEEMLADIESWTNRANNQEDNQTFGTWTRPLTETPKIWQPSWHLDIPQLEWDYYPEGFYSRQVLTPSNGGDSVELPYEREHDFIQQHGEHFVTFNLGGMGGAIHTGGLSWYPDRDDGGLCGLSGGSLAAFWTEKGGIGILGRGRGSQGPTPDTWDKIDSWMVNHMHGVLSGIPVSSARDKNPFKGCEIDGNENAIVRTTSEIVGVDGEPLCECKRMYDISKEGLQISAKLLSDFDDSAKLQDFTSLYETLPLWLGDGYDSAEDGDDTPIQARIDGLWDTLWDTGLNVGAVTDAVAIKRHGHLTLIEFETPQTVHLGPVWSTSYQRTRERGVPLHIDIKETGAVRYTISGPYKHQLVKA